jgi:hypothetical protein
MLSKRYSWKRYWCPWDGSIQFDNAGYLIDPEGPYAQYLDLDLRLFEDISELPCLGLLGEPGIGKTTAMVEEQGTIDERVQAMGEDTLWLDLRCCGSEYQLVRRLFNNDKFKSWLAADHRLHVFLDSLDEGRLRIENIAALLVEELRDCPIERLSLRVSCRTAEWPSTLEHGLRDLWGPESFGVYELAPLRGVDVSQAADANGLDPDAFLRAVDEAEAVPLAIKPVTLEFLLGGYHRDGKLPARQAELYLNGCRWLCEERNESRIDTGRTGELCADQRLAIAARIAAVSVFSNKNAISTGVESSDLTEGDMLVRELAGGREAVGEGEVVVSEAAVRETLGTGLFSARGPKKLGWAHQTYAEFLAARFLVQRDLQWEQMMSVIMHPDEEQGRLVPQLHETAAWLASMSCEIFREVMDAAPEVLLRSDVVNTDLEDKARLIDTLLRLYDEGKLLDLGLVPPSQYRKLKHAGLAEQLRPYVADANKGIVVRKVALAIAEACEVQALQGDAAEVALDPHQDLLVRKEAAHFVARVGDNPTRGLLKPLARGEAGDDPDDDLKGNGLRAVWPEHMSTEELFGSLTPPNESYIGSYAMFLNHELREHLRGADLPAALAWVERQVGGQHKGYYGLPYSFRELMDQVMSRAWDYLDVPAVRKAFARAALARLRQHDDIVRERPSIFAVTEEPSFSNRVASDDEKRRSLVEEMLYLVEDEEEDAFVLVYSSTALVLGKDVAWLIDRLESATSERRRSALAALIGQAFDLWDDDQYELVYQAYLKNPILGDFVGRVFDPVDVSSELAEEQRRYYEKSQRRREQREDRPLPDPPLAERVLRALDDFDAGNVDAFWQSLVYYMEFDESGRSGISPIEEDLREFPGWQAAEATIRERIVEAAKRYLLEGDPITDEWLESGASYRPPFAGYRALRLLMNLAPNFVSEMPDDVWKRWTPAILDYPISTGTGEEEPHLELVAMAYKRAPGEVIRTTLLIIDRQNEKDGHVFVTSKLKYCWDDRLAHALLEKAKDTKLKPQCLRSLLEDLLDYALLEAKEFAESLVSSGLGGGEEERLRAVVAAWTLIFHADDAGWLVVWPAIRRSAEFGSAVVDNIAGDAHHSGVPQKRISERQVADLYIWLVRQYPPSEYKVDLGDGMTPIGRVESIAWWREDVLRELQGRGTVEACQQIERLIVELPKLEDRLQWALYRARAETRRRTWVALEPRDVLSLVRRAGRAAKNGDQPVVMFFSYAHKDEAYLDELKAGLIGLQRQGLIKEWYDREILGGQEWEEAIDENLEVSAVILFLITPNFMASDFIYEKEMSRALEKHERGEARVIPIIVRPTDWHWACGHLQALPKDAKPITTWPNHDEAWLDVVIGIRKVVKELRGE